MTERGELGILIDVLIGEDETSRGWRKLTAQDGEDLTHALLRDISLAMLPARLVYQNTKGLSLCILAGNRRLCSVAEAPSEFCADVDMSVGVALSDTPEHIAKVTELLHGFCATSTELLTRSALLGDFDPRGQQGISPQAIQDRLSKRAMQASRDPTESLAAFLAPVMDNARTWVMTENDAVVGHSASAPDHALVQSIATLRSLLSVPAQGTGPQLLVHGRAGAARHAAVFAWSEDWVFGATDVGGLGKDYIQSWRAAGL
ncbi:hypothetical protein AIOL_003657 [Candidatus Rhodobacter oscarellae]|uniref:Uncharacterized protein n=1 Tax=Candidatus Rhodobacter oscarellae TaxID=1675527 RepID=A0A0J9GYY9_9RHOB|nr:hypothetical protein [Candidatus Rhodobacter lobularis]KMW58678.1 hypothetical protein AIOL_003657 [Candidatus Rhodobacter lobularis]